MDDDTKNHAKFLILSHMIFVCKYQKKLLNTYGDITKALFEDIAQASRFSLEQIETDQDHLRRSIENQG